MITRTLRFLSILLFSLCMVNSSYAISEDDLLPAEEAFDVSATVKANLINIKVAIADGYYLYHDKFSFSSSTPGITLDPPQIPRGKIKQDEFFGEVETHRGQLVIQLPYAAQTAVQQLALKVRLQGCADIGVCYPPTQQTLTLRLPSSSPPSSGNSFLSKLNGGASNNNGQLLDADVAFTYSIDPVIKDAINIQWRVQEGYYLYQDKFNFTLKNAGNAQLGETIFSAGKEKDDPYFGLVTIHRNTASTTIPIKQLTEATEATLLIGYQGCADVGLCYPPITKSAQVNLTPVTTGSTESSPYLASPTNNANTNPVTNTEQGRISTTLQQGSLWLIITTFFGLGILLAFTPCVFPMIPILSSIIAGQGENVSTRKAFWLSVTYVLSMALTYTAVGIAVGLSGENIQVWFQQPLIISLFAGLFVLFALAMFGFFELQLPASLQSKLTQISNQQKGGAYRGVIIMGVLSALIVGPCVTAPLIGALVYIAQTGDAVLGGSALFALSIGMGVPLILIGTSAGRLLPKAGPWMDAIKATFGVLMLGLAIWMLDRILPTNVTILLTAILTLTSAIYMGALEPLKASATGWHRLWKSLGVMFLAYALLLLIGLSSGQGSLLTPLKPFTVSGSSASPAHTLNFRQIKGLAGLESALAEAQSQGTPVMLDFYADWCVSCKEMEAFVFNQPEVATALNKTLLIQADVTVNDAEDQALLKRFGIFGPPSIIFFSSDGHEIPNSRLVGFVDKKAFLNHLTTTLP